MSDIQKILKHYFGFNSFRPLQEEVIHSILNGSDTLALMPTGGGKSLCYQVPALAKNGICLVISPLIALMKDQVQTLRKKNITAYAIYSGMSRREVINTLKVAGNSNCKFLYVSPERLETNLFKEYLPGLDINLIAVDEAHCISEWGYDFRPPYLRIAALREELPGVPVLALSASATQQVQQDICEKLAFKDKIIFRQSFERPNLSYSVFHVDSKINKIIEVLTKVGGSAIIYCKSRKRTKDISELLQLQNISVGHYHAGLPQEQRNRKQEEWINNKTRVIVCTNAFGMGIDKADVRVVIHSDVPDCLENYYQEAGRAGRDGKTSFAVLLYDDKEIKSLQGLTALRYPTQEDIRNMYQSVANYLQIPSGEGQGKYYDFDITDFLKKFKLNSYTTLYSLKALEQEGWLAFNEQVFLPSFVHFTTDKNYLYEFEKVHPELEPLINALLRTYEGIFHHRAAVSEMLLGGILNKDAAAIKIELSQLQNFNLIAYDPQKDNPQIVLLVNRIKAEDLTINMVAYNKRKEKFHQRIKEIIHFVKEKATCRSQIIGSYFGDDAVRPCGICDNCLRLKAESMTNQKFETINSKLKIKLILTKGIDQDEVSFLIIYKPLLRLLARLMK